MVNNCIYDFTTASKDTKTPFRYTVEYRNYIMVTQVRYLLN